MGWAATYGTYAKVFPDWRTAADTVRQFIDSIAPPTQVTMLTLWDNLQREDMPLHVTDGTHTFGLSEV